LSSRAAKADLDDEDDVGFEDGFDDAADGVVGEAAVEGLDQRRRSRPFRREGGWHDAVA
jgi:hypothetical protein